MITAAAAGFTFDEKKHEYRDDFGSLIASVTQVLRAEGFLSFLDKIDPRILERKRQLGKLVHEATALLDQGEDLSGYDVPDEVLEYVEGYGHFLEDTGFAPDLIEHRQIGEALGMGFGMTVDRRGLLNGETHVLEIKCVATMHPACGLQLAGYEMGLKPFKERPRDRRVGLQLGPQLPRGYKLYPYDDPADYQIWMNSLANMIWKQNRNLYEPEAIEERLVA